MDIGGSNGFTNNQSDRAEAAGALAEHVLSNLANGEDITLIGHSHGGNVAIQAIDLIQAGLDEANDDRSINLITIATPAYNGESDPENPANTSVDSHTHFFSEFDQVQTTLANAVGSKNAKRTYSNGLTNNIKVNDQAKSNTYKPYNPYTNQLPSLKKGKYGPVSSHSIHQRPELLKKN